MTQNPELMTFNQATLVAPLFLISVLFLPTLFYVLVQSIKFYGWGWANWITSSGGGLDQQRVELDCTPWLGLHQRWRQLGPRLWSGL